VCCLSSLPVVVEQLLRAVLFSASVASENGDAAVAEPEGKL